MERTRKTAAEVLLRWARSNFIFMRIQPIVKPKRIEENANIYDFELTKCEVKSLDTRKYEPCMGPYCHPP
jgi:diketogulonate reductase-like aldo/keto reductase